jgi:acetolactate synthase I/II/III large subunit
VTPLDGAETLALALEQVGVTHVFGLPGTQNAPLFPALARTRVRTVLAGSELMAAFMANGFARTGGGVPVVAAIPGPGFTYALTGFAEAAHDSAALVLLTAAPSQRTGKRFNLQALDQVGMVRGLAKRVLRLERPEDSLRVMGEAVHAAVASGPGPVMVEVVGGVLHAPAPTGGLPAFAGEAPPPADAAVVAEIAQRLREARKVVVMAGQGAAACPGALASLIARRPAMVLTTVSARGALPESHPWSLAYDFLACSVEETNRLLDEADLVLVLGCRTSQNGTGGFGLRLPEARTAQVDLDPEVLGGNYAPRWLIQASVATFLARVLGDLGPEVAGTDWSPVDVAAWRDSLRQKSLPNPPEPRFPGTTSGRAAEFFAALQAALPSGTILVTDTGHHQIMARAHLRVDAPRGLLVPADFQSMGFGLPAAIGAALAAPDRRVVAILGDGGLMMSGLELATAVRERIALTAIVFHDGQLGQIRAQQQSSGAGEAAVALASIDFAALAAATGAHYVCVEQDAAGILDRACRMNGVVLVDVPLGDSAAMRKARWAGAFKDTVRRTLGHRGRGIVRRILGRP